jgi:hypothetical protein
VYIFPGNHLFIAYWEAFSFHLEMTKLMMYFFFHQEKEEMVGFPFWERLVSGPS